MIFGLFSVVTHLDLELLLIFSICVVSGNPYYDSLGSLGVGTLLGTVSAFLIYTNTEALLGRSIQAERVQKLTEFLENDPAVRSVTEHTHTHTAVTHEAVVGDVRSKVIHGNTNKSITHTKPVHVV